MHVSQQINDYCLVVRRKFNSKRKMTYQERREFVILTCIKLNEQHERQINPDFLLKILCLDHPQTCAYWYKIPDNEID